MLRLSAPLTFKVLLGSLLLILNAQLAKAQSPADSVASPSPFQSTWISQRPKLTATQIAAADLQTAIYEVDVNKVSALLSADISLAKTTSLTGMPPLVKAVGAWNYPSFQGKMIVTKLLDSGADVNASTPDGITPLLALAMNRQADADSFVTLLNRGANVNAKDRDGKNGVSLAVNADNSRSLSILLVHRVDVNSQSDRGDTPLHLAINELAQNRDDANMVDTLLKAGANVNIRNGQGDMPIHLALRLYAKEAAVGDTSFLSLPYPSYRSSYRWYPAERKNARISPVFAGLVLQLVNHHAKINARDQSALTPLLLTLIYRDKRNYAILMHHHAAMDTLSKLFNAAAMNDTATLARLVKLLPDIADLRTSNGITPLHIAALWNAPDAVRLLLHAGLDPGICDAHHETPLHYACCFPENSLIVSLLLKAGANADARDDFDEAPLHLAIHTGSAASLRLLLAHKASPDLVGDSTMPLKLAVDAGEVDMAKALIDAGANVNRHLHFYPSLLIIAIEADNIPMVAMLLSKGTDVNYAPQPSMESIIGGVKSPLIFAVEKDNIEIVRMLLDKGADVNYKTSEGASVTSFCRYNRSNDIADLLIKHGAK